MDTNGNGIVILVDTREARPLSFHGYTTARTTLKTADYSCIADGQDLRDVVAIERKSVSDLLGCIGGQRVRFEKELCRFSEIPYAGIVVEESMAELVEAARRTQMTPRQVLGSVLAWQWKYHIPVTFCSGRHYAAAAVRTLLLHGARYATNGTAVRRVSLLEQAIAASLVSVRGALCEVADVLEAGREKHPDDDGFKQPASFHIERAQRHLEVLARGDRTEGHLAHAATRLLMALEANGCRDGWGEDHV